MHGHCACGRPSSFHSTFADDTHSVGLIVNDDGSENKDNIGDRLLHQELPGVKR